MNLYLAKLVFRIICGDGAHTPQFDEQLRLIYATDELHALTKAQQIGHREQETFYNNKEKLVQWQFVDVSEVNKVDSLIDGAELYSYITEQNDADNYTQLIHAKASRLLAESSSNCYQKN